MASKGQVGRVLVSVSVPADMMPKIKAAVALTGEKLSGFFYNAALDRSAAELEQAARNGMPVEIPVADA